MKKQTVVTTINALRPLKQVVKKVSKSGNITYQTHVLMLDVNPSVKSAIAAAAALKRTDDKTASIGQITDDNRLIMNLSEDQVRLAGDLAGTDFNAFPADANSCDIVLAFELRNIGDIYTDTDGNDAEHTEGHAQLQSINITLNDDTKLENKAAFYMAKLRAVRTNATSVPKERIVETPKDPTPVFSFRDKKKGETANDYAKAKQNAEDAFNVKHNVATQVA